jgi:nucleoside-diphosphate-sugar epimerase
LRELGHPVRALVRDTGRAAALSDAGVELVHGDLADRDALSRLVADSAALVHCAGAVRGSSQQAFDAVNVRGTDTLLEVLRDLQQRPRLLLLSSLAAREPHLSWYAASKFAGEQLLAAETSLDWCVLRPPPVYGPGDEEMKAIFQWMSRGIALVPGAPQARISLIHVSDLVKATIACLEQDATRHRTFNLCDGKAGGYDWNELAEIASTVWGRPVRVIAAPRLLLDAVARLNLWLAGITGSSPMLTPPKLRELRHPDWVVDNRDISASTGWTPEIELPSGLSELSL